MIINDTISTREDRHIFTTAANGVLANDSDPDGALSVVTEYSATAQGGAIYFQPDGSYVYLPAHGFTGTDAVSYTARDPLGNDQTGTLTITVTPAANQPSLRMADDSLTGVTPLGVPQVVGPPFPAGFSLLAPLVPLSTGGFAVFYRVFDSPADRHDAYLQFFSSDGDPIAPAQLVSDGVADVAGAHIVALSGGGVVAAWFVLGSASRAQVFDETGVPIGLPIDLDRVNGLAALDNGNFVLLSHPGGTLDPFTAQIYSPLGAPVGASATLANSSSVQVVADADGGYIVVWRAQDMDGSESFRAQRYDDGGTAAGSEFVAHDMAAGEAVTAPTVTSMGDGRFVLAWAEQVFLPVDGASQVHTQLFGAGNQPIGSEFVSAVRSIGSIYGVIVPKITALEHGYVVTWEEGSEPFYGPNSGFYPGAGAERYAAHAQIFDDSGRPVGTEIVMEDNPGQTAVGTIRGLSEIVALPDGGFAAVLHDFANDANVGIVDPENKNVVIQIFDAAGHRVGNEALVTDSALGAQEYPFFGLLLSNGKLAVIWNDDVDIEDGQDNTEFHTRLFDLTTSVTTAEDAALTLPLVVEVIDPDNAESITHVDIAGLPADAVITAPAGMSAAYNASTGLWVLTGTIPATFTLSVVATNIDRDFTLLMTAYAHDAAGGPEAPSAALALPVRISRTNPDAPVARDDARTGLGNADIAGSVVAIDPDTGDTLTYSVIGGVAHGALTLNPDGSYVYTPDTNYRGTDSFTFRANDGGLDSNLATVTLTVLGVPPTDIVLSHDAVAENSTNGTVVGTLGAIDPNTPDTAAFTLLDDADGRFAISGDKLVVANGALLDYESAASHQVTVRVTDAGGLTFEKVITVSVTDVDEAPHPFQWAASTDLGVRGGYQVAGTGDFNGDGIADVLWRNPTTGAVDEWTMQDGNWSKSVDLGSRGSGYQVAGIGDFNGDGTSDMLWRETATGKLDAWIMKDGQWSQSVDLGARGTDWKVLGTGDFNGDGTDDILFQNTTTGAVDSWVMANGNWSASTSLGSRDLSYSSVGIGDLDGDGTSDVLWRNPTTGAVDAWHMRDGNWAGSIGLGSFNTGYELAAVNDFNGDGTADVLWRDKASGKVDGWVMEDGNWFASVSLGAFDPAFRLAGSGDFDHAGGADVLWHNAATGQVGTWLLGAI